MPLSPAGTEKPAHPVRQGPGPVLEPGPSGSTVLIVGHPEVELVSAVGASLAERGLQPFFLHSTLLASPIEFLVSHGPSGSSERTLRVAGRALDLSQVRAVWRPGRLRPGASATPDQEHWSWLERESERVLEGLWGALECRWVPASPTVMRQAVEITHQLEWGQRVGWRTPRTLVTNDPRAFLRFYSENHGRVVSRAQGGPEITRNGERFRARSHVVGRRDLRCFPAIRGGPAVFQEYIPAALEVRAIVVGRQVIGIARAPRGGLGSRRPWLSGDGPGPDYQAHLLPVEIQTRCRRLLSALGLACGELELIRTAEGEYVLVGLDCLDDDAKLDPVTRQRVRRQLTTLVARAASAGRPARSRAGGLP